MRIVPSIPSNTGVESRPMRRPGWIAAALVAFALAVFASARLRAGSGTAADAPPVTAEPQPFNLLARRVVTALDQLGQPLPASDRQGFDDALASDDTDAGVADAMSVLDRHTLAVVQINPEARVSVTRGAATPALVQAGTRLFLVKVINQAGITAPLRVTSPQAAKVSVPSWSSDLAAEPPHTITPRDIEERWADISFFDKAPLAEALSGVPVEYRILEVYSRDAGQRAAELKFDVGQGTADLAFRSDIPVVFTASPARRIGVRVEDERGRPSIARLILRDGAGRVYPAMSKRLAPDLPFQAQVYRSDGEGIVLPDGKYKLEWSGGPDYLTGTREITIGPRAARRVCRPSRALDRSGGKALVLRRSPRPRCRLLALPGSDEGVGPDDMSARYSASVEHRQHPHVGSLLLPPEAVLLRARR